MQQRRKKRRNQPYSKTHTKISLLRFFERPICKRCQAFSVGDKKDAALANVTSWGSHMPLSHRLLRGWSHISCAFNICASPEQKWDACAVLYNVWARFSIVLFIPSLGKQTQRVACWKQKERQNLTEEPSPRAIMRPSSV